jgi:ABC-type Zn uptake system ZnuABC Zn-binding protein ZnuA
MAPELADPLASVLAEEYHTNKEQYEHNAREYTKKYASRVLYTKMNTIVSFSFLILMSLIHNIV